jgi:hypothetical protein
MPIGLKRNSPVVAIVVLLTATMNKNAGKRLAFRQLECLCIVGSKSFNMAGVELA